MRRLLHRRGPGVRPLAHEHAHHGGISRDTQTSLLRCRGVDLNSSFSDLYAADEDLLHEARAHRAVLRRAQPV